MSHSLLCPHLVYQYYSFIWIHQSPKFRNNILKMAGPRLTGPAAKLARSITTSAQSSTLLTGSKAAAPLSRKYADLLKERNIDPDVSFPSVVIACQCPPLNVTINAMTNIHLRLPALSASLYSISQSASSRSPKITHNANILLKRHQCQRHRQKHRLYRLSGFSVSRGCCGRPIYPSPRPSAPRQCHVPTYARVLGRPCSAPRD